MLDAASGGLPSTASASAVVDVFDTEKGIVWWPESQHCTGSLTSIASPQSLALAARCVSVLPGGLGVSFYVDPWTQVTISLVAALPATDDMTSKNADAEWCEQLARSLLVSACHAVKNVIVIIGSCPLRRLFL